MPAIEQPVKDIEQAVEADPAQKTVQDVEEQVENDEPPVQTQDAKTDEDVPLPAQNTMPATPPSTSKKKTTKL